MALRAEASVDSLGKLWSDEGRPPSERTGKLEDVKDGWKQVRAQ